MRRFIFFISLDYVISDHPFKICHNICFKLWTFIIDPFLRFVWEERVCNGPVPSSRGKLYQDYLPGLQALQGTWNGGSQISTDGGGQTGGTQGAGEGTEWHQSLGERYRLE